MANIVLALKNQSTVVTGAELVKATPFQILPGGYMSVMNLPGPLTWTSINARNLPETGTSDRNRFQR
jgi:hypothetical protein